MKFAIPTKWSGTRFKLVFLSILTLLVVVLTVFSLSGNIQIVFTHFYYVPIIFAAYWFQQKGVLYTIFISAFYIAAVYILSPHDSLILLAASGRVIFFIGISLAVSLTANTINRQKKEIIQSKSILERTQFAFDHSPDEIYYVNSEGQLTYANLHACESFAIEPDSPIHKTVFDINPEITQEQRDDIWSEIVKNGRYRFESVHRHTDGTLYPVDILEYLITHEGKESVCTISRDITERKKMDDALKEVNKKLNLLSSITRHDVLNQITVAEMSVELMEMDGVIPQDSKGAENMKRVANALKTIERQIVFTRDYQDLGISSPGWQKVGVIIDKTAATATKELTVVNELGNLEIYADPLFEKVVYNLFDNAVRHGDKITTIRFYSEKTPEGFTVVCEDDGVGIPADVKEKIFNRQYYQHTGLGLFLSREILAITCLSITETGTFGEGARFEIHVPEGRYREVSPSDDKSK